MNTVALKKLTLYSAEIETPLGTMLAIGDNTCLHLLAFTNQKGLDRTINRLLKQKNAHLTPGSTSSLLAVTTELEYYFSGSLTTFKTPLALYGTPFQQKVWKNLMTIPHGKTQSYKEIAQKMGNSHACRAVAQANAHNHFVIIVPCHRVIAANGKLSGYNGGVTRKQWLLEHEKKISLV